MVCNLPSEIHQLLPRKKLDLIILVVFIEAFIRVAGTGVKTIKQEPGNQWTFGPVPSQEQWSQTKGAPLGGWDDELSNPQGSFPNQGTMWKLEDSIPGVPGQSYPNLRKIPLTSFDCRNQIGPGYYADIESKCQVFHICQADGRQNSFLCPVGTIFNQQTFTCDWWFNVVCSEASVYYVRNGNLYKSPYIGIDGVKVSSYRDQRSSHKTRNAQQTPVAIPNVHSVSKGGNWNQQDPSPKHWRNSQRASLKGDNNPMTQRGMRRRQNRENKGSRNINRGQGNFAKGLGGSRRSDEAQQRIDQNQRGWNLQGATGTSDRDKNQGGRIIPNTQIFNQQTSMKGVRKPNIRDHSKGQNGRNPNVKQQMGYNRNTNSNKGFDTNTWSIRGQNFQVSSQDRKSSSSEIWSNNNADDGLDTNMYKRHKTQELHSSPGFINLFDEEHFENKNLSNEWNYENENSNQWEENAQGKEQGQWSHSHENDYDYS